MQKKLAENSDIQSDNSKISQRSVNHSSLYIQEEPEDTVSDENSEESYNSMTPSQAKEGREARGLSNLLDNHTVHSQDSFGDLS